MDEGQAGAASTSGAADEAEVPNASAFGQPGQQEQGQQELQQQQTQQLASPIAGARNYGYPDEFMMYAFKVGPAVLCLLLCHLAVLVRDSRHSLQPCNRQRQLDLD
jgi:hypothetical protein